MRHGQNRRYSGGDCNRTPSSPYDYAALSGLWAARSGKAKRRARSGARGRRSAGTIEAIVTGLYLRSTTTPRKASCWARADSRTASSTSLRPTPTSSRPLDLDARPRSGCAPSVTLRAGSACLRFLVARMLHGETERAPKRGSDLRKRVWAILGLNQFQTIPTTLDRTGQ